MEFLFARLKRKHDDIKQQLASVNQQVDAAKRRKTHRGASSFAAASATSGCSPPPRLQAKLMRILLMVCVFADYQMDAPVAFAMGKGRALRFEFFGLESEVEVRRQSFQSQIEDAFIAASDKFLTDLIDNADPTHLFAAARYTVEHSVYAWLLSQNCQHGVAPGKPLTLAMAYKFIPACAPDFIVQQLKTMIRDVAGMARNWLHSFRRRWHVTADTCLPIGHALTQQQRCEKAASICLVFSLLCHMVSSDFEMLTLHPTLSTCQLHRPCCHESVFSGSTIGTLHDLFFSCEHARVSRIGGTGTGPHNGDLFWDPI